MDIKIICVGKIKEKFYIDEIDKLTAEIRKKNNFSIVQLPDVPIPKKSNSSIDEKIKEQEGNKVLEVIKDKDYVIGIRKNRKEIKTVQHKAVLDKAYINGYKQIVYVIGGSLGTSNRLRERMNYKLSFSKMTLPHQLMRVVLFEEISRVV